MVVNDNSPEPGRAPRNDGAGRRSHHGKAVATKGAGAQSEDAMPNGANSPALPDEVFRQASRAQRAEIVKHREKMSRRCHRMISLDEAARDWINTSAARWREEFERRMTSR